MLKVAVLEAFALTVAMDPPTDNVPDCRLKVPFLLRLLLAK
jgi:hypothetical protein